MRPYYTLFLFIPILLAADIPLFWWQPDNGQTNFGDELSPVIVERIIGKNILKCQSNKKKLLSLGSIIHFANENDVIWGSGINGKHLRKQDYHFANLDVRSVRGPLTRSFLSMFNINVPALYGDPALLMPLLFPEFKVDPKVPYIVIPHISEINMLTHEKNLVLPTEPWEIVVQKIIESEFVISSSLHGIVVAEAFGIPARWLRITNNEPTFKYIDYYFGTGRFDCRYATSISEALMLGGEASAIFDNEALLAQFPYELFDDD